MTAGATPGAGRVGESWRWVSSGPVDEAAVLVRAPDFDLARAVTSRRSAGRLRGRTERGDVEPCPEAAAVPGGLPEIDLSEF